MNTNKRQRQKCGKIRKKRKITGNQVQQKSQKEDRKTCKKKEIKLETNTKTTILKK